jgi:hypothetical protein
MTTSIRVLFDDEDIVISREELRRAGIRPGAYIEIVAGETGVISKDRGLEMLRELWGLWDEDDEENFLREREAMWRTWQPRN